MDTVALLLSRLAFTILIHIIFSGLHTDFQGSCSAAIQSCMHVLGKRVSCCLSADAVLHSNQLRHL